MDTLMSSWVVVCLGLTALAMGVAACLLQRNRRLAPGRPPRETKTVALVRRRRELSAHLRELAGDGGSDLLLAESRRLRASTGTLEVLEAAVATAERNTAMGELLSSRMAPLASGRGAR